MNNNSETKLQKKRIRGVALDADYSIYHEGVKKLRSPEQRIRIDVIQPNKTLLDTIKRENAAYDETICFVGSSKRQSYDSDKEYSKKYLTPSFFVKICEISKEIGATMDGFLLADIYSDSDYLADSDEMYAYTPSGDSFEKALKQAFTHPNKYIFKHADWKVDETAFSIIYTQIHKLASDYPGVEIDYDYYHNNSDAFKTIKTIKILFEKYPHLLPKNVKLRLMPYSNGEHPRDVYTPKELTYLECQGTGRIDYHYAQNIRNLANEHKNKKYFGQGGAGTCSFAAHMNRDASIAEDFIQKVNAANLVELKKVAPSKTRFCYTSVLSEIDTVRVMVDKTDESVERLAQETDEPVERLAQETDEPVERLAQETDEPEKAVFSGEKPSSSTFFRSEFVPASNQSFKLRCLQALFLASAALVILAVLIAAKAFSLSVAVGFILLVTASVSGGVGLLSAGYGLWQQKQLKEKPAVGPSLA